MLTEQQKIAHLLRRFGLGASEQELEFYGKDGLKGAIDRLLNYEAIPEDNLVDQEVFFTKNNNFKPDQACGWWTHVLIRTKRPLQERMTVFWHNHFATSGVKVNSGYLLADQNEIFRRNATGKFPTLLSEVSKDPAMLYWLDNHLNVVGKPNENFAREVMELFTLGVGNYSEKDVQEAARAFTGWTYQKRVRAKKPIEEIPKKTVFVFNKDDHDDGAKTVLGKSGNLTGDDLLELLCNQAQTARYVTLKIWEWFVHDAPEAGVIERHATAFRNSGLDIATLLRSIMSSDEFYSEKAYRRLVKIPIDVTVVTARQLGLGSVPIPTDGKPSPAFNAVRLANNRMGMELLAPPDVSGWKPGLTWITSATMIERVKWADRLFSGRGAGIQFATLLDSDQPRQAVEKLLSIFDAEMPAEKVNLLVDAATKTSGGSVTRANANIVASAVTKMIFGCPEFQAC
ncbi:MAG: DUF1800 domain-containing protein [Fimbriimonadaceae bacterium]